MKRTALSKSGEKVPVTVSRNDVVSSVMQLMRVMTPDTIADVLKVTFDGCVPPTLRISMNLSNAVKQGSIRAV